MENAEKRTELVTTDEARAAIAQYWHDYRQQPEVKERRRNYQREYMRKYRARKKAEAAAQQPDAE